MDSDTVARMIERGEVDENNIIFNVEEEFELPPGCTDISSIANEAKLISERIMILKQAHLRFSLLSKVSYNSGLDFERHYRALYDDIKKHHDVWFDKLFNVDNPKPTHAEFATGILGTLCTILRQRGDIKGCAEVMPTYMAVLKRYQQMTEGCGSAAQINCCEGLTYKANIIRINLGVQLPDKQMTTQAFHEAVAFEKKEKALGRYDVDNDPDMDGVLECFFGHNRFDEVSDDDIFQAFTFMNNAMAKDGPQLKLKKCGCCDKTETMHGDFKKCSRCHQQPYCSKKCQTMDWKIHKHICGERNKTNLDSESLLFITKTLVKNHTATVEMRSNTKVALRQQQDAAAGLIKKLKVMFIREFAHFNAPMLAGDAASDPAFCEALAKFFAQQPGYEKVWGPLSVGYKEMLEEEREMKRKFKCLTVPDDVIREICGNIAKSMTMSIGLVLADGDTSEMINLDRHNKLVDELVVMTKKFVRGHMEYDSYAGLKELGSNAEYRAQMAIVIAEVMGIEGEE